MVMRDLTISDVERLHAHGGEVDETLQMDEETFRTLHERTARPLWAYLSRMTGDRQAADDLLQETYYRFLRTDRNCSSDAHRRNYLFKIATNLVADRRRKKGGEYVPLPDDADDAGLPAGVDEAQRANCRQDLGNAMARLTPRQRNLLWLAYAHGSSHDEIAGILGMKATSVKQLLFRARRRLAELLGGEDWRKGRGRS
jgi:RNA polymerase sigma-70 factor, ECF subfamily